ncbi:MAG TPA: phosphate ABC transporter substrate-binding protein, partial [Thermoanaerobaculia bacterium]|nr:phosphate ABC transporter substrate-binding protein [Thermoanaerobaculia bacterium]
MYIAPRVRLLAAIGAVCMLGDVAFVRAATLRWVGCDISKASFMDEVGAAFTKKTGHVIEIEDGGATRGIRDVAAGKAEMGGSCRHALDLKEERGVKLVPVAWDALVVVVHSSNPVSDVTRDQLRGILTGKITSWKELGGRDAPIEVFERKGKLSGVGFGTRLLLFGNPDQEFTPKARIFDSTRPLEDALEQAPNAVAMTGISSARLRPLKKLAIGGKPPTRDNVISGKYLLYRPLYLTVPERPDPVVSQFIKFLFSAEGQALMKSTGTV